MYEREIVNQFPDKLSKTGIITLIRTAGAFAKVTLADSHTPHDFIKQAQQIESLFPGFVLPLDRTLSTTQDFLRRTPLVSSYIGAFVPLNTFLTVCLASDLVQRVANHLVAKSTQSIAKNDATSVDEKPNLHPLLEKHYKEKGITFREIAIYQDIPVFSDGSIHDDPIKGFLALYEIVPLQPNCKEVESIIFQRKLVDNTLGYFQREMKTIGIMLEVIDEIGLAAGIEALAHETTHSSQPSDLAGIVKEIHAKMRAQQMLNILRQRIGSSSLIESFPYLSYNKFEQELRKRERALEENILRTINVTDDETPGGRLLADHNIRPFI